MNRLYNAPDDFEALIRILPFEEGGRRSAPFNGIRWDFPYAEDDPKDGLWVIWPDFTDTESNSLPRDRALPIGVEIPARMTILNDELRIKVHQARVKVGTTFFCQEGPKRVAFGTVTKITGLFDDHAQKA